MTFSAAWFAGWRALALLLEALAPWGVPLDVPRGAGDAAMAQCLAGWLGLTLLAMLATRALERTRGRAPWAWLVALTVAAAGVTAVYLPRGAMPLGFGVRWVGPLLWSTFGASALAFAPRAWRRPAAVAVAVLAAATALAALPRLRDVRSMWRTVVAQRPDHAEAATQLAALLRPSNPVAADAVLDRCVRAAPANPACWNARAAARLAAGRFAEASEDAARALHLDARDGDAALLRARAMVRQRPVPAGVVDCPTV